MVVNFDNMNSMVWLVVVFDSIKNMILVYVNRINDVVFKIFYGINVL